MIGAFLTRWLRARRDRPDPGLQIEAAKFGTKKPNATAYDEAKALTMARQARQQSASGRAYRTPTKAKKKTFPANVTPLRIAK